MNSSIDINRLEKIRRHGRKIIARCPACAAEGGDRKGTHFFQNTETGQFGCAKHPGDSEHRREIFRLIGIPEERDPAKDREWRRERALQAAEDYDRRKVSAALRAKRSFIVSQHPWTEAEARAESPARSLEWFQDPRHFLAALFPSDSLVWTGEIHNSGQEGKHAARWKTVSAWQHEPEDTVGPMVSPCTWNPGTTSRSGDNVATSPFVVLDFDGFDGKQPVTLKEISAHVPASMALVRWLREDLEWNLAALIHTGNKSLHAWFYKPPPAALASLRHTADALGVDAGLIDHPEHPCRLPGWIHPKTGKPARVLWLQSPTPF
jgi:hypothetical protein